MKSASWSSYFWPGTEILKNKLNIKEKSKLSEAEKISTGLGIAKIAKTEIKILNSKSLLLIHKLLFDKIYDWAGKLRTVNMSKNNILVYNNSKSIAKELKEFDKWLITNKYFSNIKNKDEVLSVLIQIFSKIQSIHPFREGNTRSSKVFVSLFGNKLGYTIDWTNMSAEESMYIKFLLKNGNETKKQMQELYNEAENIISKYLVKSMFSPINFFSEKQINEEFYKHYKDEMYDIGKKVDYSEKLKAERAKLKKIIG